MDWKEKVDLKISELKNITYEKFKTKVEPKIIFDLESIRTLGYFDSETFSIHLNEHLLEEFGDLYIEEVVIHEFAHCVAYVKYGPFIKTHGKEWKYIAKILGLKDPKASTNKFKNSKFIQSKKGKTYTYECKCQTYELTKIRHNKIKKGIIYRCPKCGAKLKYKGENK